jgi:hypothetical protein
MLRGTPTISKNNNGVPNRKKNTYCSRTPSARRRLSTRKKALICKDIGTKTQIRPVCKRGKISHCTRVSENTVPLRMFRKYKEALKEEEEAKQAIKEEKRKKIHDKQVKIERSRIKHDISCKKPKYIPRTRVWNQERCALIPRGQNMATARDTCDSTGIEQCHGTCYFISVMVLLTKLKMIYNHLKQPTKEYADAIKTCRRINRGKCLLAPRPVRHLYMQMRAQRNISLNMNNEQSYEGGYPDLLFKAILVDSKIPFSWLQSPYLTKIGDFSGKVIDFEDKLQFFLDGDTAERPGRVSFIHNGELDTTPLFSIISLKFISRLNQGVPFRSVMIKLRYLIRKFTSIVGGHVNLVGNKVGSYDIHQRHSVAFSVCGTRILMCNWGECDDPMSLHIGFNANANKKLSQVFNVTELFLIFDNGLVQKEKTLKRKK